MAGPLDSVEVVAAIIVLKGGENAELVWVLVCASEEFCDFMRL